MKKLSAILLLCAAAHAAQAVEVSAVHFRAAGVDVATQQYLLRWAFPNIGDTADIQGVQVLKLTTDSLQNTKLDTVDVLSAHAMQYADGKNSCCAPIAYALRLLDKNPLQPSPSTHLFRTMQLGSPALDTCANAITLRWSAFEQLNRFDYKPTAELAAQVRYHIYGHVGGSTFNPDSVVWLATAGSATSHALPVVEEKKWHHLFIAAVYNGDTSYSNPVRLYTPLPIRPRHISIDSVLVGEQRTTLRFRIDSSTEYRRFWLEKSNDVNGRFEPVAEFSSKRQTSIAHSTGGSSIVFYRISSVNSCPQATASSPVATTLGVVVHGSGRANHVSWNAISYSGYPAAYSVHRTAPPWLAAPLGSTPHTTLTDDLALLPDSATGATFCYTVEAAAQNEQAQTLSYVRSAAACSTVTPQVHMPNALQPGSSAVNAATGKSRSLFEPVSSYAHTYTLHVYSRTGKQVYGGSAPWNGRENNTGELVPEGSYVYLIKVTFANGHRAEHTGSVTVVY